MVGREASLRELLNIAASPGEHAFIASARGTGKTSLVSCFLDCASRAAPQITCVRTNCENSSFKAIWSKVLRRILGLGPIKLLAWARRCDSQLPKGSADDSRPFLADRRPVCEDCAAPPH
ncbi:AAA family ATPase [Methylocystis sp.]|uniref:AAA family ATPase n=1 Tax=Methylocystis sp. TaxID=1911079 RepID=UPI003DA1F5D4